MWRTFQSGKKRRNLYPNLPPAEYSNWKSFVIIYIYMNLGGWGQNFSRSVGPLAKREKVGRASPRQTPHNRREFQAAAVERRGIFFFWWLFFLFFWSGHVRGWGHVCCRVVRPRGERPGPNKSMLLQLRG